MPIYRATKNFHFGAIQAHLREDDPVEHDDGIVYFKGRVFEVPLFDFFVTAGLLLVDEERLLPVLVSPGVMEVAAPSPGQKAIAARKVEQKTRSTGRGGIKNLDPMGPNIAPVDHYRIHGVDRNKMEAKAKGMGGGIPAWKNPDKKHVWTSEMGISGEVCDICGVTREPLLNAGKPGLAHVYRDVYGIMIQSTKDLPCPLFVGDLGGGIATNTYATRKLKGQVETIEERVARLETANAWHQEQAAKRQEIALELLERLATAAERLADLGDTEVGPHLLADHGDIVDAIILDIENDREKVPIYVKGGEEEDVR
jgi:hypothetical protein